MRRAFLIHPRQIATAPLRSTPAGGLQEGGRKVGGVLISRAARDNHVLAFPRNQILRRIFSGFGVVVTTRRGRRPRRKRNVGCPRPPARPSRRQAHPASTRSNWGPRRRSDSSALNRSALVPLGQVNLRLEGSYSDRNQLEAVARMPDWPSTNRGSVAVAYAATFLSLGKSCKLESLN